MPTTTEVSTRPSSGLNHIDALLAQGPGWNWLTPSRTTLYYTFSLDAPNPDQGNLIAGLATGFNSAQRAAVQATLSLVTHITGITFALTSDASLADLHFAAGDLFNPAEVGLCSWRNSYSFNGQQVSSYSADAWIYLDNANHSAVNVAPAAGNEGFETLLHEIGHALGLKHPFEDGVTLPAPQDNTTNTLMSYADLGGPYSNVAPYDIAALRFLYGDDGLGGARGHSSGGNYLTGTGQSDALVGSTGNDLLEGLTGNDNLTGGSGTDTAKFSGLRAAYSIVTEAGGTTVTGPDGTDFLTGIELLQFADQMLVLAATNNPAAGTVSITGTARQGSSQTASAALTDADGLGVITFRWQVDRPSGWVDIAGATGPSFAPQQAQVGSRVRAVASYVDGGGTSESVASSPSALIENIDDEPTGQLAIAGEPKQGQPLRAEPGTASDPDGLGPLNYRWQVSLDGKTWTDLIGATSSSFTPEEAQVGQFLRVRADYTDGFGAAETLYSAASPAVINRNDLPVGSVTIQGLIRQGQSLTAVSSLNDSDGLGLLRYKWQSSQDGTNWQDIAGAEAATFVPQQAYVDHLLRVNVYWVDGHGTTESVLSSPTPNVTNVNDQPTGSLAISGVFAEGERIRADIGLSDPDGLGPFIFEWQRSSDGVNWQPVPGANQPSLDLGVGSVGAQLRVLIRYVDGFGTLESVTSQTSRTIAKLIRGADDADDQLLGEGGPERLLGLSGNDRLKGGGGDDQLVGGSGLDKALFDGKLAQYQIQAGGLSVRDLLGSEGSDVLEGVERLVFADRALAFDFSGHASTVARILGAVFGSASVKNAEYAGIGLSLLDGGMSTSSLLALALEVRLGPGYSHASEVTLLFQNLLGRAPDSDELGFFVGSLTRGEYTHVSLAQMAADLELNALNINLVGLAQDGLPYVPI